MSGMFLKYEYTSLLTNDLLLPFTGIFVRMFKGDFPLFFIIFTVPVFIGVAVCVLESEHSVTLANDLVGVVSQPAELVRGYGIVQLFDYETQVCGLLFYYVRIQISNPALRDLRDRQ